MEKLSGLVLDIYDDGDAQILTAIFPSPDSFPEIVKEAHYLTPDERGRLPDDVFALVLLDGDLALRKYACVDAGNTALSVEYFLKTGHKLPKEAQKLAAENLTKACGWYDIEPPEQLQKIALGLDTLLMGAMVGPGAVREAKSNLAAVQGTGGHIVTPQQVKARRAMMGGV